MTSTTYTIAQLCQELRVATKKSRRAHALKEKRGRTYDRAIKRSARGRISDSDLVAKSRARGEADEVWWSSVQEMKELERRLKAMGRALLEEAC